MITYTRTRWLSYAVQYSVIVTTESCWIWLSYEWTEMICESKNRRIWNILINYNYTAWLHHCYIRFNIANISLITWAKQTKACMPRMVELFSWLVSSFIHTGVGGYTVPRMVSPPGPCIIGPSVPPDIFN